MTEETNDILKAKKLLSNTYYLVELKREVTLDEHLFVKVLALNEEDARARLESCRTELEDWEHWYKDYFFEECKPSKIVSVKGYEDPGKDVVDLEKYET